MNNPALAYDIVNQVIKLNNIEMLFDASKYNVIFQEHFQNYIRKEL